MLKSTLFALLFSVNFCYGMQAPAPEGLHALEFYQHVARTFFDGHERTSSQQTKVRALFDAIMPAYRATLASACEAKKYDKVSEILGHAERNYALMRSRDAMIRRDFAVYINYLYRWGCMRQLGCYCDDADYAMLQQYGFTDQLEKIPEADYAAQLVQRFPEDAVLARKTVEGLLFARAVARLSGA